MLAILLPCGGGPEIPILSTTAVVGRQTDCDVSLTHRSISGRHCQLECVDGFWRVRDLGSSNGTRVNGITVNVSWLMPDDELTLGKERFYLIYIAPEDKAPPPRASSLESLRKPMPAKPAATSRKSARAWTLGELVPCGGGESIPLVKSAVLIGRTLNCDVTIEASDVSGQHCRLEFAEGYWFVRDLGSRNGTRVDNEPCVDLAPILPDSVLTIGRHRYRLVYTPEVSPGSKDDPFSHGLLEKAGLEEWDPGEEEEPGKDTQS
jgi:pSer/pThr/pTyr-binding forkhead associated (FHA) protein